MGTNIRPNISLRKKYWIEKHRYYELKHFCLQYASWKKAYAAVHDVSLKTADLEYISSNRSVNPTENIAMKLTYLSNRIEMIEKTCTEAAPDIASYLLKAITEDLSYEALKAKYDIPAGREKYYDAYRRFFWLLDKERG